MSESTEVAVPMSIQELLARTNTKDIQAEANELETIKSWLPYLRLVQGQSPLKLAPFNFPDGALALHIGKDDPKDLGLQHDVLFIAGHGVAMDNSGEKPVFNRSTRSEEFKKIRQAAENGSKKHFWGYEMLVWLGGEGVFCTLFCNQISTRRFARETIIGDENHPSKLNIPLTLSSENKPWTTRDGQKTVFRIFTVKECTAQFACMPSASAYDAALTSFKRIDSPVDAEIEDVETAEEEVAR